MGILPSISRETTTIIRTGNTKMTSRLRQVLRRNLAFGDQPAMHRACYFHTPLAPKIRFARSINLEQVEQGRAPRALNADDGTKMPVRRKDSDYGFANNTHKGKIAGVNNGGHRKP